MIAYEDALHILRNEAALLAPVTVPLADAAGLVTAEPIASAAQVPSFANSAMDGFAVHSADTLRVPATLPVRGSTVAGDALASGAGGAWEIMTGAPVPDGYDAVVKIEDVTVTRRNAEGRPLEISLTAPVERGNNIRSAGEDFQPDDAVVQAGTRIGAMQIMALAAVGVEKLRVHPHPRVTVFSTGKELVDDAAIPLQPGQIRNSNAPYLLAALRERGAQATYAGIIHDEPEVFEARVREVLAASDVIISTGAVSAGRHDFIPDSLRNLGATIHFHKVAIRPGKPVLYARFPNGTHYFGLPGNPISAVVGLRFFVEPLLRRMTGQDGESFPLATLANDVKKKTDLRFFQKAVASIEANGMLCVRLLDGQESFKIHPLLEANCWAILPEGKEKFAAGDRVPIAALQPGALSLTYTGEDHADHATTVRRLQAVR
ncbi:MAG: molybdopterin molybdotransferase MoeA [Alphaproteobacteria bacterium]|nr:molybdopterin molybdotransferase MoeA [Alphaproteobacteria bacterium]